MPSCNTPSRAKMSHCLEPQYVDTPEEAVVLLIVVALSISIPLLLVWLLTGE